MTQIGPIKYNKDEGAVLARSFFLGIFLGLPLGIVINYLYGFPTIHTGVADNLVGWAIRFFVLLMSFLVVPCAMTIMFFILFLGRKEGLNSFRYFIRGLWAVLMFFAFFPLYVAVTSAIFLVPLWSLVDSILGGRWLMTLSSLAEVPLVALLLAIIAPDSRPGRALRRPIHRLKGGRKKERG